MPCQRAINEKVIPVSIIEKRESWYSHRDLERCFNIKGADLNRIMAVHTEFNMRDCKNRYKPKLNDSVVSYQFISSGIKQMLDYYIIIKSANYRKLANYDSISHLGLDDDEYKEVRTIRQFTLNYLRAVPPEKRLYISDIFSYDMDEDGVNELFQVTCSNGIIQKIVIIKKTENGVAIVKNNLDWENKILDMPKIKLMKRISQMPGNILNEIRYR